MNFKTTFFTLLLTIGFLKVNAAFEAIEFIKTKSWKIEKLNNGALELSCVAVFYNPNNVKAKLKDIDLNVFFNTLNAGNIKKADGRVKIKKQQAFEIPLSIKFSPDSNAKAYFSGFLTAFTLKDFVIKIEGYLKLRALGIPLKIKVNTSEDVNLKQLIQ